MAARGITVDTTGEAIAAIAAAAFLAARDIADAVADSLAVDSLAAGGAIEAATVHTTAKGAMAAALAAGADITSAA